MGLERPQEEEGLPLHESYRKGLSDHISELERGNEQLANGSSTMKSVNL